jgi:RNA polymerase sigma-70 factor (ECF subfamily)
LERQYAILWDEYGAGLMRLASSYEGRPQAREDLLQDIRLAIWMALPKFRSESSLRTFVFRIAHNRALAHAWKRKDFHTNLDDLDIPDQRANPEQTVMEAVETDRLQTAIRSLPVPMMQVITLALEEISHREIAEILGTTENNVAVRLNRARGLLRQKLGEAK